MKTRKQLEVYYRTRDTYQQVRELAKTAEGVEVILDALDRLSAGAYLELRRALAYAQVDAELKKEDKGE